MTTTTGTELRDGTWTVPTDTRATFSVWRTQGDTVRFAYGADAPHTPVQRTAQDVPWADGWFFTRFRPVATTGTWLGRDPLAAARA